MAGWGPGQTYAVELGKTWNTDTNHTAEAYHTIRYDFRPSIVDTTRPGKLSVESANKQKISKVTLNLQTTDDDDHQIKFEGNASAAKQECILIFDKSRNTFVLERLTKSVKLQVNTTTLPKAGEKKRGSAVTDDDHASAKRRKAGNAAPASAPATTPAPAPALASAPEPAPAQTTAVSEEGNELSRPASAASSAGNPRETPVEDDFDLSDSEDGSGASSSGEE